MARAAEAGELEARRQQVGVEEAGVLRSRVEERGQDEKLLAAEAVVQAGLIERAGAEEEEEEEQRPEMVERQVFSEGAEAGEPLAWEQLVQAVEAAAQQEWETRGAGAEGQDRELEAEVELDLMQLADH